MSYPESIPISAELIEDLNHACATLEDIRKHNVVLAHFPYSRKAQNYISNNIAAYEASELKVIDDLCLSGLAEALGIDLDSVPLENIRFHPTLGKMSVDQIREKAAARLPIYVREAG